MHSAQELVSQIEALTSLPTVYERVREQLESPDGSVFEVARLVSADPALTARLLRLVNSAMYGYRGEIDNVVRAVQILACSRFMTSCWRCRCMRCSQASALRSWT